MYAGLIPRCAATSVRNRAEFEDRTGPDHSLRRNPVSAGEDGHNPRHDVNRIRRHQEDGVRRRGQHRRHDLGKDFGVARQQVEATLTGYWLRVFGFSGLEELIGKVDSGERGVTTAILK